MPDRYMNGSTSQAASSCVAHRNVIDEMPMNSSASISSEIRIEPSSATMPVPTFAAIMYANAYGMTSRRLHSAVNAPADELAPTAFAPYAPSTPHWRPRTNTSASTMNMELTM